MIRAVQEIEAELKARGTRELSRTEPVTNPNEPVRAGDVLVIEIAGEPDLPRNFVVREDGTIRLPLIGSIKVLGSTVRQVRDAVAKQIIDRKLGTDPGVAVSLRRRS